ncbi:MAG: phosphate ABC transporter permease PstA [Clostridiales bacterium]|jgi:phosphate transport system permease protein|nr:phosphate ABC transporter permease PstA [Clostridiales bacterium]
MILIEVEMKSKNKKAMDYFLFFFTHFIAFLTFVFFLIITCYMLAKGIPHLKLSFFEFKYTSKNMSVTPSIFSTIIITFFSLLLSIPTGIFSALYLIEYSKQTKRIISIIRIANETLAGLPSIIYALFGRILFVSKLGLGFSVISAALTLSIMTLPLIIRTTEESLKTVPKILKEGSFALGVGQVRTIFKIIIPTSFPGIFSGILLSTGRIIGETIVLIYTAGTVPQIPCGKNFLFMSARTLSVHMYSLSSEGLHLNEAYSTSVVLFILIALINFFSNLIRNKLYFS